MRTVHWQSQVRWYQGCTWAARDAWYHWIARLQEPLIMPGLVKKGGIIRVSIIIDCIVGRCGVPYPDPPILPPFFTHTSDSGGLELAGLHNDQALVIDKGQRLRAIIAQSRSQKVWGCRLLLSDFLVYSMLSSLLWGILMYYYMLSSFFGPFTFFFSYSRCPWPLSLFVLMNGYIVVKLGAPSVSPKCESDYCVFSTYAKFWFNSFMSVWPVLSAPKIKNKKITNFAPLDRTIPTENSESNSIALLCASRGDIAPHGYLPRCINFVVYKPWSAARVRYFGVRVRPMTGDH